MAREQAEILIVGGGIAGLSTAYHLACAGCRDVLLLDREELPGFYASGHNAGVGRQLTGRPEHTALAVEGARRLHEAGLIDGSGGLLLGAAAGGTETLAAEAKAFGLPVQRGAGAVLPGLRAVEHLAIPSDGVIDIDRMLGYCAEGARAHGARLQFGWEVQAIHSSAGGFEVETDHGSIHAKRLVNAAGAWCGHVGRMAGGLDIAFKAPRRHLIWSNAPHPADQPWAWWADRPLYVRPESGGLLMCACEEQDIALPHRHAQPENEEGILEDLFGSLRELAPAFSDLPIARLWCGLRTFAPDRRFVIGYDPINPNLFWVAGLGGHGMTSGLAVGERAARAILGKEGMGVLEPARLLGR
jgi:glycine/D-amino acid oxidase-like deaminating enzyme